MSRSTSMSFCRIMGMLLGRWLAVVGIYALVSITLAGHPDTVSTFGNLVRCMVPLLANAGLLLNAGTPHWRRNIFWMLLAMGCTLWMIGQFQWTYYEVYEHQHLPTIYGGALVFFLKWASLTAGPARQSRPPPRGGPRPVGALYFFLLFARGRVGFPLSVFSLLPC